MGVKVAFLSDDADSDEEQTAAVYVSEDAVRTDSEGNFVWIVRDGEVQRRKVSVGQASRSGVQIMSGLGAGDRIVVAEEDDLIAGQTVEYE